MDHLTAHAEKMSSSNEAERIYAAEDIGYLNAAEGVSVLVERLDQEPSRAVRDAIFQALGRIEAEAAIEGCIRLLAHDDPLVRNQAVEVLRRKGAASIPFLQVLAKSGDKDLRKLVLDVLSGFNAFAADAIYEAALSDPDPNVVITAVENLGQARAKQFRPRIEELLLADSHPMLVGACLEALAGIGDTLSLPAIRRRFPDLAGLPDFYLMSCLKAIGALGSPEQIAEVAQLLALRGPNLRPAILSTLFAIQERHPQGQSEQVQDLDLLPILQAVADRDDAPLCRYQAVRVLGFLAFRPDVYAYLVSCLDSPERLVRLAAIESLRLTARCEGLSDILLAHAAKETDEDALQALSA